MSQILRSMLITASALAACGSLASREQVSDVRSDPAFATVVLGHSAITDIHELKGTAANLAVEKIDEMNTGTEPLVRRTGMQAFDVALQATARGDYAPQIVCKAFEVSTEALPHIGSVAVALSRNLNPLSSHPYVMTRSSEASDDYARMFWVCAGVQAGRVQSLGVIVDAIPA